MPESERRRRRPPVSCVLCRRRKIRCNKEVPCSNCVRSKSGNCVYTNYASHPAQRVTRINSESHYPTPATSANTSAAVQSNASKSSPGEVASTASSSHVNQQSTQDVESLNHRIRQLEEQLSKATKTSSQSPASTTESNIETITSRIGGTFHIHHEDGFGQPQAIPRSITHKTRLFGQSHWVTGFPLVRDVIGLMEPLVREEASKAFYLMNKSKAMAREIKARRAPPWPTPPNTQLPPKDVADELVDRYFRTVEPIYRVLHVPNFRRDYEAHWVSPNEPNMAFLIQLKLVLAIGATTYDDRFSLRTSAMQWVYEAQTWVSEPGFKHRLNISYLQTNILLLLAREFADVGPDLVWISAGTLFRTAVYMGLHKDPTTLPKMTMYTAEMRRRLWNTLIEISLQLSLTSGGPPFMSLDMFDIEPPGNFDDEQITAEDAVPKPENHFTQTSIALALRKTFPVRLAIAKFLNDHNSHGTYSETLRLDAELKAAYKPVLKAFQGYKSSSGPKPSEFEIDVVSLIMNRYVLSLHIPYFAPAMQEAAYAFSRKVVVETSLKMWRAAYPPPLSTTPQSQHNSTSSLDRHDLARLTTCASGFFRIVVLQASVLIAAELIVQLREEDNLGPGLIRQDLLSVLEEGKTWALRCIEAGETSIKGYFLASLLAAQVEGLMQGLGKEELPQYLIKAAEQSEEKTLPLLEEMIARGQSEISTEGLGINLTPEPQAFEDWDFEMSDALIDFGDMEPVNWVFNGAWQDSTFS
ncbi:putative C6 transcription factor [Hypoxylon trugodes]|uniref:putative C6 transcription factor n=1 Tax=Hypoxylon trugodes TaxID=326681 RepID=UPI00219A1A8A|nr:putative C6 transcription factor [Hypoxylon trugodes]KAI1388513.1 putative C6 transcription factor [Hypoxylon trugodes]